MHRTCTGSKRRGGTNTGVRCLPLRARPRGFCAPRPRRKRCSAQAPAHILRGRMAQRGIGCGMPCVETRPAVGALAPVCVSDRLCLRVVDCAALAAALASGRRRRRCGAGLVPRDPAQPPLTCACGGGRLGRVFTRRSACWPCPCRAGGRGFAGARRGVGGRGLPAWVLRRRQRVAGCLGARPGCWWGAWVGGLLRTPLDSVALSPRRGCGAGARGVVAGCGRKRECVISVACCADPLAVTRGDGAAGYAGGDPG